MDQRDKQSSEILDVVDLEDRVIGQATRSDVHKRALAHRAAHIFLFNSAGSIYVQRRSPSKDRHPSKLDSSAAGHVDSGENYLDCAIRELKEELGIEAVPVKVLKVAACPETDNEHVELFEVYSDVAPIPDWEEISSGDFMSPANLTDLMRKDPDDFVPAFVLLWRLYLKTKFQ
jgi:isopentenyl-diphosphate Delta-isomerase